MLKVQSIKNYPLAMWNRDLQTHEQQTNELLITFQLPFLRNSSNYRKQNGRARIETKGKSEKRSSERRGLKEPKKTK